MYLHWFPCSEVSHGSCPHSRGPHTGWTAGRGWPGTAPRLSAVLTRRGLSPQYPMHTLPGEGESCLSPAARRTGLDLAPPCVTPAAQTSSQGLSPPPQRPDCLAEVAMSAPTTERPNSGQRLLGPTEDRWPNPPAEALGSSSVRAERVECHELESTAPSTDCLRPTPADGCPSAAARTLPRRTAFWPTKGAFTGLEAL